MAFTRESFSLVLGVLTCWVLNGSATFAAESPDAPPATTIKAIFPKDEVTLQPLVISVGTPDLGKMDSVCKLAPTEIVESRGLKSRAFKTLADAPEQAPNNVSQALFKIRRLTVDADGSARSYHPDDPFGTGICDGSKTKACALDELPNAGIRLFQGAEQIDPQNRKSFETSWSDAWSVISKRTVKALDNKADSRIPKDFALYYFKDKDLTVVFKTQIIPFANGSPCVRPSTAEDPGYFVAATSFTTSKVSPETVCQPSHYLDASKIPFVVLPGDSIGKMRVGDIAIGIAQSDTDERVVFGIIGDTGPFQKIAEGSIAFNSKLLGRQTPLKNSSEQKFIDIDLDDVPSARANIKAMGILILGGTSLKLAGDYSAKNIDKVGGELFAKWSGPRLLDRLRSCMRAAEENPHVVP
jgi:hypothetical protein